MAAKTFWFVVYPASENPGNSVPANARIASAQQGSAAYNAWTGNGAYTVQGQSWQVDAGPFGTQADAQKWAPQPLSVLDFVKAGAEEVLQAGLNVPASSAAGNDAAGKIPNPFDALAGIAGALRAFYDELTNAAMWKSFGWGVMGALLLLAGVAMWAGVDKQLPPIIPV